MSFFGVVVVDDDDDHDDEQTPKEHMNQLIINLKQHDISFKTFAFGMTSIWFAANNKTVKQGIVEDLGFALCYWKFVKYTTEVNELTPLFDAEEDNNVNSEAIENIKSIETAILESNDAVSKITQIEISNYFQNQLGDNEEEEDIHVAEC